MQGIRVDKSRLRKEMSRQAAATVTTHHVHLFSCKLTSDEMDIARKCAEERTVFGNAQETERTYIEIVTLREAIPADSGHPAVLDFTTLGMVLQTIGLLYDSHNELEVRSLLDQKDAALARKVRKDTTTAAACRPPCRPAASLCPNQVSELRPCGDGRTLSLRSSALRLPRLGAA